MDRKHPKDLRACASSRRLTSVVLAIAILVAAPACNDSLGPSLGQALKDAGAPTDDSTDEATDDPGEGADARAAAPKDTGPGEEDDAGRPEPIDAGSPMFDAGPPLSSDAGSPDAAGAPPVIMAPPEVKQALCSDAYDSVKLSYSIVTRGSWQANPGATFIKLSAAGYPCAAFLEEKKTRPPVSDLKWTDAADGAFLGFSESSTISTMDYTSAQFRYFRSFIFVPSGANLKTLSVDALGIDDSIYLELTNSRYPKGISPLDVGPSDPAVGACQGNGKGSWNLATYMAEGEINVLLLVHADLAAATSTLLSVDVRADGAPIQLVSCKK